jgi:Xaa-Pro dipeptidase
VTLAAARGDRHARLREALTSTGATVLVTTSPESFAYVSSSWIPSLPWVPNRRVFSAIWPNGAFYVLSSLQAVHVRDSIADGELMEYIGDDRDPVQTLIRGIRDRGLGREAIAVELQDIPWELSETLNEAFPNQIRDGSQALRYCELRKDQSEIEELQRIGQIVSDASLVAARETAPGESELDFARRVSDYTLEHGALDGSFTVGSGKRSSLTHAWPSTDPLVCGDVLRVDVVRRSSRGYFGDIARMFTVDTASEAQIRHHAAAVAGMDAAIDALGPGSPVNVAFEACEAEFEKLDYAMHFPHVGHSIGLRLHEPPVIDNTSELICEPGMTFCVETILQVTEFREWYQVEHLVCITDEGVERLAGADGQLISLGG